MTPPVQIRDVIVGKYRIERVLGSSGMGIVYAATHIQMDTPVAVKFLLSKSDDHDTLVRFEREAKFTAKIRNEHVVRVLDVGHLGAGIPFIVMEYLDGHDLAREVASRGPMPVEVAVDFLLQACEGLQAAHDAGVVHRDVKPSNLFLARLPDRRTIVKVIDFGVAKYRGVDTNPDQQNESLTTTSLMIGSPRYMAPEQVRASRDVDSRADVWALGVILYEFLTGKPAFKGPSLSDSIVLILTADAPRVEVHRPDVPPGLAEVIGKALEKDPERRTPTVAALARSLLPFATNTRRMVLDEVFKRESWPVPASSFSADGSGPLPAMRDPHFGMPRVPDDVATKTTWDGSIHQRKRSRVAIVGLLVVAFVVIGAGALMGGRYYSTHAAKPPASQGLVHETETAFPIAPMARTAQVEAPTASASATAAILAPTPPTTQPAPTAIAGPKKSPKGAPPIASARTAPTGTAAPAPTEVTPPPPPAPTENKGSLFDDPK